MFHQFLSLLWLIQAAQSYKTNPTSWVCIEPTNELSTPLASCLPGYVIDIDSVTFESTHDDSCSGISRCQSEQTHPLVSSCNRKRTCQLEIAALRFHLNSTCGSTKRFFIKYRCLPVIYEQKDYVCDSPSARRVTQGDINLSCARNFRIHITSAIIGMSLKPSDELSRARYKCNKDTISTCHFYASDNYRHVCTSQLTSTQEDQCKIRYHDRPGLNECSYGSTSNYSMVEYLCIPGKIQTMFEIDVCIE
jgi:hypothetical protein